MPGPSKAYQAQVYFEKDMWFTYSGGEDHDDVDCLVGFCFMGYSTAIKVLDYLDDASGDTIAITWYHGSWWRADAQYGYVSFVFYQHPTDDTKVKVTGFVSARAANGSFTLPTIDVLKGDTLYLGFAVGGEAGSSLEVWAVMNDAPIMSYGKAGGYLARGHHSYSGDWDAHWDLNKIYADYKSVSSTNDKRNTVFLIGSLQYNKLRMYTAGSFKWDTYLIHDVGYELPTIGLQTLYYGAGNGAILMEADAGSLVDTIAQSGAKNDATVNAGSTVEDTATNYTPISGISEKAYLTAELNKLSTGGFNISKETVNKPSVNQSLSMTLPTFGNLVISKKIGKTKFDYINKVIEGINYLIKDVPEALNSKIKQLGEKTNEFVKTGFDGMFLALKLMWEEGNDLVFDNFVQLFEKLDNLDDQLEAWITNILREILNIMFNTLTSTAFIDEFLEAIGYRLRIILQTESNLDKLMHGGLQVSDALKTFVEKVLLVTYDEDGVPKDIFRGVNR